MGEGQGTGLQGTGDRFVSGNKGVISGHKPVPCPFPCPLQTCPLSLTENASVSGIPLGLICSVF